MKICIALLISCFYALSAFPQLSGEIKAGPMIKHTFDLAWADIEPIGHDDEGVCYVAFPYSRFVRAMGGSDYYLIKVSKELELDLSQLIDFAFNGQETAYGFVLKWNDQHFLFTSHHDEVSGKVKLLAQEIDLVRLTLGPHQEITTLDANSRKFKTASFDYKLSEDHSKLLLTYNLADKDQSLVGFEYDVFEPGFKRIASWNGNLDMSDGVYFFDEFAVSNSGRVYLLSRYFETKKDVRQNVSFKKSFFLSGTRAVETEANYETRIVKFGKGDQKEKIFAVEITAGFLTTAVFSVEDQILVGGFYSRQGSTLPIGAVFVSLDPVSGEVLHQSAKEFGDLFALPSNTSGKVGSEELLRNYRFLMKDLYKRENGGYLILGERLVTQTKTSNSGGVVSTTTFYQNDDIAAVEVSKKGDVNAVHKIEKSQQTTDLGYFLSSYFFSEQNGNLHFLFTNLGKKNANMMGTLRGTTTVMVTIDESGNQDRKDVFNAEETSVTLLAQDAYQMSPGVVILNAKKSNRFSRFLKLN
ncbi:MAG: hypothetical protein KI790_10505 [Cyclobacteriaceae bacterium]|nr:hypothetical protein [Cyclobacteriaceae bacterium HetDA_MAG_MS6]